LIDTIEKGVNDQLKSAVGIGDGDDDDEETLTTDDRIDEEDDDGEEDRGDVDGDDGGDDEDGDGAEDQKNEPKDEASERNAVETNGQIPATATATDPVDAQRPQPSPSAVDAQSDAKPNGPATTIPDGAKPLEHDDPLSAKSPASNRPHSPPHRPLQNGNGSGSAAVAVAVATAGVHSAHSASTEAVGGGHRESPKRLSMDSVSDSHSKPPRKQSKSSKKTKSKQNKSHSAASSASGSSSDYVQLKRQYEGMVKLWNEERAHLKKAQHLLRAQKDKFKAEQDDLGEAHLAKISKITAEFDLQISLKNKSIASLERALLKVKEERNDKMMDRDKMSAVVAELRAEREAILREKAVVATEKKEQIESIRRDFEEERRGWDKERAILTKNFERESFLENENQEFTSALARTQSALQQKELENSRIAGELRWLKQDKEEMARTNDVLKDENETLSASMDALREQVRAKKMELAQLREEQTEALELERERYSKLMAEHQRLREQNERSASDKATALHLRNSQRGDFEQRIEALTTDLLEKQTEMDRVVSQRNELRLKLSKMEEALRGGTASADVALGMDSKGRIKDAELGVLTNRAKRKEHPTGRLPRNNYTAWKTINRGIGIFDKIGLEFAHILRNKPWVRLLILFYVLILHLWCFLVLHFSLNFELDHEEHH